MISILSSAYQATNSRSSSLLFTIGFATGLSFLLGLWLCHWSASLYLIFGSATDPLLHPT